MDEADTVDPGDESFTNPTPPVGVTLTSIVPQVLNAPSLTNPYITISFNIPVDPVTITYRGSVRIEYPFGTQISDFKDIKSQPTQFLASDDSFGLPDNDYALDIQVDGTNYQIIFTKAASDTWADIAQEIENSLTAATSGTETCEIINGRIRIISGTTGITSEIEISAGTAAAAGGDFLAAVDSLPGYATEVEGPLSHDNVVSKIYLTLDVGALGLTGGETIRIVLTDDLKAESNPSITLYSPLVTIDVIVQN